jgi:arylsulfatase A-like enzyme
MFRRPPASHAARLVRRAFFVSATTSADRTNSPSRSAADRWASPRLGPLDVLVFSLWCGLAGGLLEVGARVVGKTYFSTNRLYMMSRHFVWLAPLSNLLLFAVLGAFLAMGAKLWPRLGRWIGPRLILFLTLLPVLIVLIPRIYEGAWVIFATGAAVELAPLLERRAARLRRWLLRTFPALLGVVLLLTGWRVGGSWLAEWREGRRAIPPGDPPNLLLITLDTVRADHLSLHGYGRPTSPALEVLAKSGIRFDEARAAGPWTLPSHASLFTGRWPHELGVDWNTPLGSEFPTLAGYLSSQGYATAGFVANTMECSYDNGLDRGFAHFEDYILEYLLPFRTAWLFDRAVGSVTDAGVYVGREFNVGPLRPLYESWLTSYTLPWRRKDAGSINRAFLDWLSRRAQPGRPFFAFLNYYDAHAPYVLPRGGMYRFGLKPRGAADFIFLMEEWEQADKTALHPKYRELARDCYDDCLAYLDRCLGDLFRELQRRGVLDHTWLIVTADHGEGLGEHDLFDHGESLYRPEIHVPLLIVPPAGQRSARVVRETVSLRDLPATIVDVLGLAQGSPFPGSSLAGLWREPAAGPRRADSGVALAELPRPNPYDPNHGRSPAYRGPLVSIADGGFVYIRNQGDGGEELYDEREDPGDAHDLSRVAAMRPILERLRGRLDQLK